MVKRNELIDDDNLTELPSLTHLLDKNITDSDDRDEAIVINIRLISVKQVLPIFLLQMKV